MDLTAILPSLYFTGIGTDYTSYNAGFDHLSNVTPTEYVDIHVYHDGSISFMWLGVPDTETFYTKPTTKDLYDFARLHG